MSPAHACGFVPGKNAADSSAMVATGPSYDWSQVTSVAFNDNPELMCLAHSHGARVIMSASFDAAILANATARAAWVQAHVQQAIDQHMDGRFGNV